MQAKDRVREFVLSNFYVPDSQGLIDSGSLLDQGIIDSTGILELIFFIEGEFAISVEDSEMLPENLDSIDNIAAFVSRKSAERLVTDP